MTGYLGDPRRNDAVMAGGYYHTGDVASRDDDGYITYIGRTDDVFKSSDYKVSPFELESGYRCQAAVDHRMSRNRCGKRSRKSNGGVGRLAPT
jgi:long-subunit acyl-CoA synthetase (AMP-forming)